MGPTKAIVKDGAIYDAKTGKLMKDGLTTHEEIQDYVNHHYIALPVVNKACEPWVLDGEPIYCLRGTRYENLKDEVLHLARCPDCGGMGSAMTNPWSNRIAFAVSPAAMSLMPT